MATKPQASPGRGKAAKKLGSTPRKGSVADTNTKQMAMGFWTPRHLRRRPA
jgi:hypothetical protein